MTVIYRYSSTLMKKPLVVEESDSEEEEEESRSETEAEGDGEGSSQGAGLDLLQHEAEIDQIKEEIESESEISESEQDTMLSKSKLIHSKVKNNLLTAMQPEDTSSTSGEEEVEEDIDDDFGNDDSDNNETEDDEKGNTESGNSGLANVMAKILATKKSENVILSKAKKDWTMKEELEDSDEDRFEVVDSSGQVKREPQIKVEKEDQVQDSMHDREMKRRIWGKRFRVKPNVTEDHEKERRLRVLATQGVVQLFSAIEKHRNMVQKKLSETRSVMGREKVLETTGKEAFMEMLREQGKKVKSSQEGIEVKPEMKEEIDLPVPKKPKWNVFADNFYKEPTLQGWDQQSDED